MSTHSSQGPLGTHIVVEKLRLLLDAAWKYINHERLREASERQC